MFSISMLWRRRIRIGCASVCGAVACLALAAFLPIQWLQSQILTTDNWVALTSPLPQQPVVAEALGRYVSGRIFTAVPVEDKVAEALPERAVFLAGPLSQQLESLTVTTTQKVIASDGFRTLWEGANRAAHSHLIATARDQAPTLREAINDKFTLRLDGIRTILQRALGSAASIFPELQAKARAVIAVSVGLAMRADQVRQSIRTADTLYAVLPYVIAAGFFGSLALSLGRRMAALRMCVATILLLLLELVVMRWDRQQVLQMVVDPRNVTAVGYIFDTLTAGLRELLIVGVASVASLSILLWLAGPSRWATGVRSYLRLAKFRQTWLYRSIAMIRMWVGRREGYILAIVAALALISIAFFGTAITNSVIIITLLAMGAVFAVVHIIATPRTSDTRHGINHKK